jgi:taurine dioxygenase
MGAPLTVVPLAPALGAEVHGVDVAAGLSERDVVAIRDAVLRHAVVVLRGQRLEPGDQLALTDRLWPLRAPTVLSQASLPDHPQITVISNIVESGRPIGLADAGLLWHTDMCFTPTPELFVSLYARRVPTRPGSSLGDTRWISTTAAYDALPEARRCQLDGLRAVQSYPYHLELMARRGLLTRPPMTPEQRAAFAPVDHPVVRTHPITGRRSLYVNESFTASIVGWPEDRSRAFLDDLCAHLLRPEFELRHQWQEGDLVVWDNSVTQHHATFDYGEEPRLLHRCGTDGPVPV